MLGFSLNALPFPAFLGKLWKMHILCLVGSIIMLGMLGVNAYCLEKELKRERN